MTIYTQAHHSRCAGNHAAACTPSTLPAKHLYAHEPLGSCTCLSQQNAARPVRRPPFVLNPDATSRAAQHLGAGSCKDSAGLPSTSATVKLVRRRRRRLRRTPPPGRPRTPRRPPSAGGPAPRAPPPGPPARGCAGSRTARPWRPAEAAVHLALALTGFWRWPVLQGHLGSRDDQHIHTEK